MRHTRGCGTGRPAAYFVLHRIGFFVPRFLRTHAVGSYPTFSLSPPDTSLARTPTADAMSRPSGYLFSVTLSVTTALPVVPRLGRKRERPVTFRPAKPTRRRSSTGILPCGVRTFLSEFDRRGITRALGSKNSERRLGSETKEGQLRSPPDPRQARHQRTSCTVGSQTAEEGGTSGREGEQQRLVVEPDNPAALITLRQLLALPGVRLDFA